MEQCFLSNTLHNSCYNFITVFLHTLFWGEDRGGDSPPPPGDRCLGLVPPPLRPTEIWKFFEINA